MEVDLQNTILAPTWRYNTNLLEFESLGKESANENTLISIRTGIYRSDLIIFNHRNYHVTVDSCEQTKKEGGLEITFRYNKRNYRIYLAPGSILATCEIVPSQKSGYTNGYES